MPTPPIVDSINVTARRVHAWADSTSPWGIENPEGWVPSNRADRTAARYRVVRHAANADATCYTRGNTPKRKDVIALRVNAVGLPSPLACRRSRGGKRMSNAKTWNRRQFLATAAGALAASRPMRAFAADAVGIGLIVPKTGPFASTGRQVEAACRLYMLRNGDTVAGLRVALTVRDDTGTAPELTKRIAQELVTRDHVSVLAGFGLTPRSEEHTSELQSHVNLV